MAGNINISNNLSGRAKPLMNSFRVVKGFSGKRSVTALSKDLIMQFPVIMSKGIQVDDAAPIAKGLEKMFASMFLAVWTADASLDVSEYGMNGVRDFVKKYHNNDDIPDVLQYTGDILNLTDNLLGMKESATAVYATDEFLPAEEGAKLWDSTENELALESLNDMYLPIKKTQKQMEQITAALERTQFYDSSKKEAKLSMNNLRNTMYAENNSSIDPYSGRPGTGPGAKTNLGVNTKYTEISNSMNSAVIVKDSDKLGNMAPTLIDVTFLVRGKGAGGAYTDDNGKTRTTDIRQQKAIVGVKTMIRFVDTRYMVSNVMASLHDQSLAFKFVKWTKGEMKVGRDMILGISRMKEDARASDQADMWFAALRKRKRAAKTFRFGNSGINPFATLIMTKQEVEEVRNQAGYDLTRPDVAKMLMDNLFLLGFVIVDTSTNIVYTMFDGTESFGQTTLKALKYQQSKDVTTADELREMRKIMGQIA